MSLSVVLAAGGTGGHVFPAQALAQELLSRGHKVALYTDGRGLSFGGSENLKTVRLPLRSTYGSIFHKLLGLFSLVPSFFKAFMGLLKDRPQWVVGFGGYISAPTLWAAWCLRIPLVLHQADAILGRVNRLMAPSATWIAISFPDVLNGRESWRDKIVRVGLPLRSAIEPHPYEAPSGALRLLVTGGSQGAQFFGNLVPAALALLSHDEQRRFEIIQQCRSEYREEVERAFAQTEAHVTLSPFFEDMPLRYERAQLIISRAGASSVMEAALVGRPGVFVPYPFAVDDHQTFNGIEVEKARGGWVFQQKDLTPQVLAKLFRDFLNSPWKLADASDNIRKIFVPDAAKRFAEFLEAPDAYVEP